MPSQSPPPAAPGAPDGLRLREHAQAYRSVPASSVETWKRCELAPGIELHIQKGAEERQRTLLERICKAAGISFQDVRA